MYSDEILAEVANMESEFVRRLIDNATDHKLAPAIAEKKAKILLDLLYAVNCSDRWALPELSLEEYAHELADVFVSGIAP